MNVSVTQETPIMVRIEISVSWDVVSPHYNKAVRDIKATVQVPGFRKGKTPLALLKKRYQSHIANELSQKLISESLEQAVTTNNIKAVGEPRLLDIIINEKKSLIFVVELDVAPEIVLQDYTGLEVERLIINITDEQVDEQLARMLEASCEKVNVIDRPAQAGETVIMSLTALDEASNETVTDIDNYQLVFGNEGAHPDLSNMLKDAKVNDDISTTLEGAEDDIFEEWRGNKMKVFVEVKEIFSIPQVELDDAFAVKCQSENLEELRTKTRTNLEESANNREEARLNDVLMARLLTNYDFQVPEAIVHSEASLLVQHQMGAYLQIIENQDDETQKAFMDRMIECSIPQATIKARANLLLNKIAEDLKIEISEEEINSELNQMLSLHKVDSIAELRAQFEDNNQMEDFLGFCKRDHAAKAILDSAKTTLVEKLSEGPIVEELNDGLAGQLYNRAGEADSFGIGAIMRAPLSVVTPDLDAELTEDSA